MARKSKRLLSASVKNTEHISSDALKIRLILPKVLCVPARRLTTFLLCS